MSLPVPCEPPDVPAFHLDDVHAMQADLFQHAQRALGPCTHAYTIAPAQFSVEEGESCAVRIGPEISIRLDIHAARDWAACTMILGHELVHALDGLTGHPTWLEEGVATLFGIGQCAAMFDEVPTHLCKGAYHHAAKLVASVPRQLEVVKALRAQGIRMCSVTPAQLSAAAPSIDARTAKALCARFQPKAIGVARVHGYGG